MKIKDYFLDRHIGLKILEANTIERANHKSSGKLSASSLGSPLQWQILKKLGVPEKPIDEYTLRKFKRGNHVEDWFAAQIPDVLERQKFCEYRGAIGYADLIVDTKQWDSKLGVIPLEVKSVSNAKFKRIMKEKEAQRGHKLQNGFYALSLNIPKYGIAYIATDDYRVEIFVYDTADIKEDIDKIIDRYDKQGNVIPVFEPEEKWQANPEYNPYPDWAELDEKGIKAKLLTIKNHEPQNQEANRAKRPGSRDRREGREGSLIESDLLHAGQLLPRLQETD